MWFAAKEEEVRRIRDAGFSALDRGDADAAIASGQELLGMRWSGGFELVALGKRAKGDHEGALAALDQAREVAPAVWSLAQLRGNVLDELGRHADAVAAYDEALSLENAWRGSIHYNRAVANAALERWGDALFDAERALEDTRDAPFTIEAIRLATEALGHLGRHEDAVALLNHVGAAGPEASTLLLDLRIGVLRASGADDETVMRTVNQAIEAGVAGIEVAKQVHRDGASGPRLRARALLRGPAPSDAPPGVLGYFRPATVRARDEAEALALLAAIEPTAVRSSLVLEVFEPSGADEGPGEILHIAGRIFFGDE